jgi:hypothetical protein
MVEVVGGGVFTTTYTFRRDVWGTRVAIDTAGRPAGGLSGLLERRFAPRMLSRIYAEELERLETYAAEVRRARASAGVAVAA